MKLLLKLLPLSFLAFAMPAFAALNISMQGLVEMVVYLLVLAAIVWLLLFIVSKWGPPEPFNKFIPAFIYTVAALILIVLLLNFAGMPVVTLR